MAKNKNLLEIKKNLKKFKFFENKFNKKKEKYSMKTFLRNLDSNIKTKSNINKLFFINDYKNSILKKEKIKESKRNSFYSPVGHINKKETEKFDNQTLFNTVKEYNKEKNKNKVNSKSQFHGHLKKEKKGNLVVPDNIDLGRRNRKQ